jgi:hypothetical protein
VAAVIRVTDGYEVETSGWTGCGQPRYPLPQDKGCFSRRQGGSTRHARLHRYDETTAGTVAEIFEHLKESLPR